MRRLATIGLCLGLVAVLVIGACATTPTPPPAPTPTPSPGSVSPPRSTQDIWFIRKMARAGPGGASTDLLDAVVAVARSAPGRSLSLRHGLIFQEAASLKGRVTDYDGSERPSIHMTFGIASSSGTDPTAASVFLGGRDAVLVALSTPDLARDKVNVDLDDFVELDLSAIPGLRIGERLNLDLVFAQTLTPDDVAGEVGLDPLEVFERRWNEQRIQILGIETSPGVLAPALTQDQEMLIVEGSTAGRWWAKAAAAALTAGGATVAGLGTGPGVVVIGIGGVLIGAGGIIFENLPEATPPDNPPTISFQTTTFQCGKLIVKVMVDDDVGLGSVSTIVSRDAQGGPGIQSEKHVEQDFTFTNPCDALPYTVSVWVTAQDTAGNGIFEINKFTVPAGCACPTPTPSPTRTVGYIHTVPGEYSDVFISIAQAPPNSPVAATLTGPGVLASSTQTGTTDADGRLRLAWRINQFGAYVVTGILGFEGATFSDSLPVPAPTPAPTPTRTPTPTPLSWALSFVHTAPGVYSEIFVNIQQAPPNTPVIASLTGPGGESQAIQTGTTGTDGKLRLTWRINQFGTCRVTGSVGGTPFSDSIPVPAPTPAPTPTRTPTPTPTATPVPLAWALSYVHTAPGVYTEIFFNIQQAPPNTLVTAALTGPGVISPSTQTGTTGTDGRLRLTWRINQFGAYRVTGVVEGATFSDSITVPSPTPTPTPTRTPTPTATPVPLSWALSFVHTVPGEYSEVFFNVVGASPNLPVTATLTGPGVTSQRAQSGTTDANGRLRLTWRIELFGIYTATGTVGGATFSGSITVQ